VLEEGERGAVAPVQVVEEDDETRRSVARRRNPRTASKSRKRECSASAGPCATEAEALADRGRDLRDRVGRRTELVAQHRRGSCISA
jgi:hypothetical protein